MEPFLPPNPFRATTSPQTQAGGGAASRQEAPPAIGTRQQQAIILISNSTLELYNLINEKIESAQQALKDLDRKKNYSALNPVGWALKFAALLGKGRLVSIEEAKERTQKNLSNYLNLKQKVESKISTIMQLSKIVSDGDKNKIRTAIQNCEVITEPSQTTNALFGDLQRGFTLLTDSLQESSADRALEMENQERDLIQATYESAVPNLKSSFKKTFLCNLSKLTEEANIPEVSSSQDPRFETREGLSFGILKEGNAQILIIKGIFAERRVNLSTGEIQKKEPKVDVDRQFGADLIRGGKPIKLERLNAEGMITPMPRSIREERILDPGLEEYAFFERQLKRYIEKSGQQ